MDVLGIDFGTSNTVGVLAGPGRPPRLLVIDSSPWIPSCIFIQDDGNLAVGRDAERKARLAPERFEANPKRRIDDGEILLGVRVVSVVDAIAAVLRLVGDEARRQLNGRSPDLVNLTHPAQWGSARQNVLLAAARVAGLGPAVKLIPEPVAASIHFASQPGRSLAPGASLAVYDLGGGTFDCAVIGAVVSGLTVLAEGGLDDVGGVDFDQAVVDYLGRTVAAQHPERWTALSRPRTAGDRRAARSLREDVRAAKETLSRYPQTELAMPEPFEDALLTRGEFESLIRPTISRTVDMLAATIQRAGLTPAQLAGIYLVGGSSRIPLVASLIGERLGVVPSTLDQPETSVAVGAALSSVSQPAQGRTDGQAGGRPGSQSGDQLVSRTGPSLTPLRRDPQIDSRPRTTAVPTPPGAGSGPPAAGQPYAGSGPHTGGQGFVAQGSTSAGTGSNARNGPSVPMGPERPATSSRRRRRGLIAGIAALLVIVVTVSAILLTRSPSSADQTRNGLTTSSAATGSASVARRSSDASSTSGTASISSSGSGAVSTSASVVSVTCSTAADSAGFTSCMKAASGSFDELSCSAALIGVGMSASTVTQLKSVAPTSSGCADKANGFSAVIFQTTSTATRDAMWPLLIDSFSTTHSGHWTSTDGTGQFSAGTTPSGGSVLVWESSTTPVVGFVGATDTTLSVDEVVNYWQGVLAATLGQ